MANPIKTETIIAGANTILVDWVGALKMGLDPSLSPLNKKALEVIKLPDPDEYQVVGSLAPVRGLEKCASIDRRFLSSPRGGRDC